jgi:hypothetical protein
MSPKPCWVDMAALAGKASFSGTGTTGASKRRVPRALKGTRSRKARSSPSGIERPSKGSHSRPGPHAGLLTKALHLGRRQQARMVVLVARERQAEALDGVGDEHHRAGRGRSLEGFEQGGQIVPAEIGHEAAELLVGAALDEPRDGALVAEIVEEALPPGGPALEGQRRVELVRAGLDPVPSGARRRAPRRPPA